MSALAVECPTRCNPAVTFIATGKLAGHFMDHHKMAAGPALDLARDVFTKAAAGAPTPPHPADVTVPGEPPVVPEPEEEPVMTEKKCEGCGKRFTPKHGRSKFCPPCAANICGTCKHRGGHHKPGCSAVKGKGVKPKPSPSPKPAVYSKAKKPSGAVAEIDAKIAEFVSQRTVVEDKILALQSAKALLA